MVRTHNYSIAYNISTMNGILPVDKPTGMTSYDVIRVFKHNNPPPKGQKKWRIGHGGTLDPFAEGVLLLLLGRTATQMFEQIRSLDKTYVASAYIGKATDTLDLAGKVVANSSLSLLPTRAVIEAAIPQFVGEIEQIIPDYSAAKINGKPRYKYAREGEEVVVSAKKVTVKKLEIISFEKNILTFETTVSSGTYIRQLSYDLIKHCGSESHLERLKRVSVGAITINDTVTIEELKRQNWQAKLRSQLH